MKKIFALLILPLTFLLSLPWLLGSCSSPAKNASSTNLTESLKIDLTAGSFVANTQLRQEKMKQLLAQILAVAPPKTAANTLEPFNDLSLELSKASAEAGLFQSTHPDEKIREAAIQAEQELEKFSTALSLNRELYDCISAVDISQADAETKFFVEKTLRDFRRSGVDKDAKTREQITKLKEELTKITQDFDKNIREDVRFIEIKPEELKGMPEDFVASHKAEKNGLVKITTNYPDVIPFLRYAESAKRRKELFVIYNSRGYPKNVAVFKQLLRKRHELARILGYDNWAHYNIEDKMMKSYKDAAIFIERVSKYSGERAKRDIQELLDEKRKTEPKAKTLEVWERGYLSNKLKESKYDIDQQLVRQYFKYEDVKSGLFAITQKLFGVTYKQVTDVKLWHPDVEAWDIYDQKKGHIGRFYLDLFPRDNKYKHAAQFPLRNGLTDREFPQAVLVTNFPNPKESQGPALMEHGEVETFFHEFGHLLHTLFSGNHKWLANSGISTEWDFVETPSQMLEEWVWDKETLTLFAKHNKTGEPIPGELVDKMRRAKDFGLGMDTRRQMYYAALSLGVYSQDPKKLDIDKFDRKIHQEYTLMPMLKNTYTAYSFGHLTGYAASYYTYMWSQVIAKDLFSVFETKGLLDQLTAQRYRETILAPGGSKPAAQLVQDFLGRPFNYEAFEKWLQQ